jgi:hypothetical protein
MHTPFFIGKPEAAAYPQSQHEETLSSFNKGLDKKHGMPLCYLGQNLKQKHTMQARRVKNDECEVS